MIVIPAQAGIQITRSTAGSWQEGSVKPHIGSEICRTVDPGLRRDDGASIFAQPPTYPIPRPAETDWITASKAGVQGERRNPGPLDPRRRGNDDSI
jgi:hypothetical protein